MDISELWNFKDLELSERRFRSALLTASVDDTLILQTQIARSYGIRRNFSQDQEILAEIQPKIQSASTEAKVRYYLELGRTHCSATHPEESQTNEVKELARSAYMNAYQLAKDGGLDHLAIDALHMMTFVDTAPEDQLKWNQKAVDFMEASSQPEAKKWEGSLHNNTGYSLHLLGRYDEALLEFNQALAVRRRDGNPESIRIAYWMVAWTLRALGRFDEAIEIQLRLEKEWDEAGEPDPFVFEELEGLYRAVGDPEKAEYYAGRLKSSR